MAILMVIGLLVLTTSVIAGMLTHRRRTVELPPEELITDLRLPGREDPRDQEPSP